MIAMAPLIQQSLPLSFLNHTRLFLGFWLLVSSLLPMSYKSTLLSTLIPIRYEKTVDTIYDAAALKDIPMLQVRGTSPVKLLQFDPRPEVREIAETRLELFDRRGPYPRDPVLKIVNGSALHLIADVDMPYMPDLFHFSREPVFNTPSSLVVQKHSPMKVLNTVGIILFSKSR